MLFWWKAHQSDESREPEDLAEEDVVSASVAATFCGAHIKSCKPRLLGVALGTSAALAFEALTFAVRGSVDSIYFMNKNDMLVWKDKYLRSDSHDGRLEYETAT